MPKKLNNSEIRAIASTVHSLLLKNIEDENQKILEQKIDTFYKTSLGKMRSSLEKAFPGEYTRIKSSYDLNSHGIEPKLKSLRLKVTKEDIINQIILDNINKEINVEDLIQKLVKKYSF